ncbi:NAD(P)-binding protein [Lepidopterella palustris CBS 459.81]|uniref:Very-long-chain 3-oxoacyl-CoA reductase n=1 Tax=Lepidopterella palustris CBS 459.81 TaxID=1314670 RepID=A0A8E2JGL7_9PEZI|nr:NAD(P)-binding protein [Lepidopterella palustris CBS 459.81]
MDTLKSTISSLGIHTTADTIVGKVVLSSLLLAGLYTISKPILSFFRLLLSLFILPGASLSTFGPKGSWALVTGASDGIGKEYSLQLARAGFNLILVSRTQSKLDALAAELTSKHAGISTKVLAMDFARNDDIDYGRLKHLIQNLDISILVNNVGLSHSIPVPFVETPHREMTDIIMINCLSTLRVTQLVAPSMIQRRRGLILTMASLGGVFPTPLLATYSGSKAFLQQWSTALGSELAKHNVRVQLVQSHLVVSAMSKIRRSSAMVPTPRQFVKATLSRIGRSGGSQGVAFTSTPYWSHALFQWALVTFVGSMNGFVVDRNRIMHEAIRKRALKKMEKDGKKGQ